MTQWKRHKRKCIRIRVSQRRCFALRYLGDGRVEWMCKAGHTFTRKSKQYDKARLFLDEKLPQWCQPGGYWSREQGGASTLCPKCLEAAYESEGVQSQ